MKSPSLTARISLLFAICAASVLLGLGWLVERSVVNHFMEIDRHEIEGKLALVSNLLAKARTAGAMDALPHELNDALVGHHGLAVTVLAPDGAILFATSEAPFPAALRENASHPEGQLVTWTAGEQSYRGLSARTPGGPQPAHLYTVAIALDITHHQLFMHKFRHTLVIAMALAAMLTAALGWIATWMGLRPLRRVTALAVRIEASQLGERLPVTHVPAEIDALATAFNTMLARLEASFRRLSEFSSDIAHELRTPVSNLMTQTQVVLSRPRPVEEYREILASNQEEYERLARMIGDMLFLAQADNRLIVPRLEEIDLAQEVARLIEFYEALAADRGVRLVLVGTARVTGDRLMLQRAISNLISNALHHTESGGEVEVRLSEERGRGRVSVTNPGEVAKEHLPRLFERFYTGDPARRARGEGAGLGLAIVKSIVDAHRGSVTVSSSSGKTTFCITLPSAAEQNETPLED